MAQRFEITDMVFRNVGGAMLAHQGGSVAVKDLQGNNLTVYQDETGSPTFTNPLTSDSNGQIEGWVEAPDFDLAVSGPGISSYTQEVRTSPPGVFVPESYGAKGDGTTNDFAALDAAADAVVAAGSGEIRGRPGKTYKFNSTLDIPSNVTLWLEGVTLDCSAVASYGIRAEGTEGSQVLLTANAVEGATTLTCAAGGEAGIAIGDWIRVGSQDFWNEVASPDEKIGELVQVEAVASGSITLRWPLAGGPYNTADTAFFSEVTPVENVTIKGGKIIHSGASATAEALRLSRVRRVRVKDVQIESSPVVGIGASDVIDAVIEGVTGLPGANASGLSYGVTVTNASMDVDVLNCTMRDYRHGINTSGGTTSARPGIVRRITISGNHVYDARSAGINCHGGAEEVTISDNHLYSTGISEPSGGIATRCPSVSISDNHIWRTGTYGIWARNESLKPTSISITGNHIRDTGLTTAASGYGIYCAYVLSGAAVETIDGITITGNVFGRITTYAVQADNVKRLSITGNVGSALTQGGVKLDGCNDVTVSANNWFPATGATGFGFSAVGTCARLRVVGNNMPDFDTGVGLSSTSTNCTIKNNGLDGCTTKVSLSSGAGHLAEDNGEFIAVVGATSLNMPSGRTFRLSNNTGVTYLKRPAAGKVVTINCASNTTFTHNGGAPGADFIPIKLVGAANFVATADDNLTLLYNATSGFFEEMSRAAI